MTNDSHIADGIATSNDTDNSIGCSRTNPLFSVSGNGMITTIENYTIGDIKHRCIDAGVDSRVVTGDISTKSDCITTLSSSNSRRQRHIHLITNSSGEYTHTINGEVIIFLNSDTANGNVVDDFLRMSTKNHTDGSSTILNLNGIIASGIQSIGTRSLRIGANTNITEGSALSGEGTAINH